MKWFKIGFGAFTTGLGIIYACIGFNLFLSSMLTASGIYLILEGVIDL